jgi:hypothetical protein
MSAEMRETHAQILERQKVSDYLIRLASRVTRRQSTPPPDMPEVSGCAPPALLALLALVGFLILLHL